MLNNFCFQVYAQKSLIIDENGNAFFYISHIISITLPCYFTVHRAGSQLKSLHSWETPLIK